ncbi:PAS domain-containing protein [Rubrivivax rivuli]|uniref:histidine kinase n=1 Tax=Rubrivivax rivuli TaxID=1862385 RepID=A0A437RQU9_9BURK|nr:PAS domain-containing protein [Rubrivivax rivuli]RVU49184.1 PAS domain S-box protein [Rubrivivax rivuli]
MDDFSSLFEFLPIGAYRKRPDGVLLRSNPALVRMNGLASEAEHLAIVNGAAESWYVQPGRQRLFMELLLRGDRVVGFESEARARGSGRRLWVRENAHAVRGPDGEVLFFEGTVEEITEHVQARGALEHRERELREITAQVPGVVYRVVLDDDDTRRIDFVSDGVRALYGVEPEDAVQNRRLLAQFRHPDDLLRVDAELNAAARERRPLTTEFRIVRADGSQRWVQQISVPAGNPDEEQIRIGVMIDITERKQAELALAQSGDLWKRALEGTGDGVWDWHVQEGRELLSPACKALYGFAPDELPDTPDALDSRTHPEDLEAMRIARDAHFAGQMPIYINEHRVRCKDGSWKWILSRGMVLTRDEQGRPLRMVGTHTDITLRKQADALRAERDRAAAADLAKSQFLSRVSHELRTPLNAVLGFTQLLELEPGDGERQRLWVAQVLSAGRHLLALMDDVLDLSSAQTGQLAMATEVLPLREPLNEALAMLAASAAAAQVSLHDDSCDAPPCSVRADRRRLLQVLSNLIGNAIKYNHPQGWVRVQFETVSGWVSIHISDSGPGLDALQQARLFQPFERLGAQRGPVAGTGLGLALSRELVEAMGGSITVRSQAGAGATFTINLPAG